MNIIKNGIEISDEAQLEIDDTVIELEQIVSKAQDCIDTLNSGSELDIVQSEFVNGIL